jgi:hypothetical protein
MTPSASHTPERYISAIASMIPDPQIPETPVLAIDSSKPGSSLHSDEPITLNRGAKEPCSILTRSIAPAVARWPLTS